MVKNMRILDDELSKKLDSVTLFLTRSELKQLIGYAEQLLEKPSADHYHLSNEDYQKEITLCIYDAEKTDNLSPRIKKLILEDK
jgi:hypothetical protein